MRNHEVTTTQPLLGPDGILQEPGWSRRPLQLYSRADIKKRPTRIKEWAHRVLRRQYPLLRQKAGYAV